MAVCDEARQLLAAARKDWTALSGMSDAEVFADEVFGFHAQQAVEKSLKAWLSLLDAEYPKTHDLTLLLRDLEPLAPDAAPFWDLVELNPYAVQLRYDAFDDAESALDRNDLRARVGDLMGKVEALIESAVKESSS